MGGNEKQTLGRKQQWGKLKRTEKASHRNTVYNTKYYY